MGIFDSIKNAFSKSAPAADTPVAPTPQQASRQTAQRSATEAAQTAAAAGKARTYTVVSGDTLWRIAERMYGNGSHYMKIFEANTGVLKDPDQIFPGQELVIPEL